MDVVRIQNLFLNSNTYLIIDGEVGVLIDPGSTIASDTSIIFEHIERLEAILLTHEHLDHIMGMPALLETVNCPVYASEKCLANCNDSRKNLSKYFPESSYTEIEKTTTIPIANNKIKIRNFEFEVIDTPGHSEGDVCYILNDAIFTGDSYLGIDKVPLNFPSSNRNLYDNSLNKIENKLKKLSIIYPGHGNKIKISNE